ncbi:MAG TPA: Hsp70 family protein [Bdellovibrionales bacterium]|nr:Hsp70 family protein [Bdellovibrionales bacterium]
MMIYAIDYGTSNSLLAGARTKKPFEPLALDDANEDPTIFRSVMFFPMNGGVFFGKAAVKAYDEFRSEGRLFRSIKKYLPVRSFSGTWVGSEFRPLEDLISRFLREMRERANAQTGVDADAVVLGRPARYALDDEADRLAQTRMEKAAKMAGFKHVEFYPEPLAAAHEYRKTLKSEKLVLVADLGAGTSDFTVLKIGPGPLRASDVLAVGGVSVAGDALDSTIMDGRVAPFLGTEVKYRLPLSSNVLTMPIDIRHKLSSPPDIALMTRQDVMHFLKSVQKAALGDHEKDKLERLFVLIEENLGFQIYEAIEGSKRAVCRAGRAKLEFPYPGIELATSFEDGDFEMWSRPKLEAILGSLDETVKLAGVGLGDIDLICCTGGTAKVPQFARQLESRFGREKIEQFDHFHSVIKGLAERASELG